ncbi:bifunctional Vps53 [Babesia duncani]|uniref:Bifunctional Vps53 n=1 Tax=Babesia duncani TaxID=323732 RepID=A0AAD9PND1_9APIC|nr:bifunctional Vps53 [Babesia duncani]
MEDENIKYDLAKLVENPVNFVNTYFPDEYCLAGLDGLIAQLNDEIRKQDETLVKMIREKAISNQVAHEKIEKLHLATNDLVNKIEDIKRQTLLGETSLNILTADIRSLHIAKQNICSTIVALKRLIMFSNTLDDLSKKARDRHYEEAAGLALVVCELQEHIKPLKIAEPVDKLLSKCDLVLNDLSQQLIEDLEILLDLNGSINVLEQEVNIGAACKCADAIGDDIKRQILDKYGGHIKKMYEATFPLGIDDKSIESINHRFSWLRRWINEFDEKFGESVPGNWGVQICAVWTFIELMSKEIIAMLSTSHDTMPASFILSSLLKCREFEQELDLRLIRNDKSNVDHSLSIAPIEFPEVLGEITKTMQHKESRSFSGGLSRCFESYLGPWIASEESQILELINSAISGPSKDDTILLVLCSSKELFVSLNERLKVTLMISFEQTLYEMFLVSKRLVARYQQHLQDRITKIGHQTDYVTLAKVTGCIVATCDYCLESVEHLTERVTSNIAEAYRELIFMGPEREKISNTKADAIKIFIDACTMFESLLVEDVYLQANSVIDASDQIVSIKKRILQGIRLVQEHYPPLYLAYFVNKVARALIAHFKNCIFTMASPTEPQCQQLLLDVYEARLILLENIKSEIQTLPAGYPEAISSEMDKLQTLVRVLNSAEQCADSLHSFLIENGGACTKEELDIVLSINKRFLAKSV